MGHAGYRPPKKQQLRQRLQDALYRAFPPESHGMPVVRRTSETPPYFSYLLGINDQNSRPQVPTPRLALPFLLKSFFIHRIYCLPMFYSPSVSSFHSLQYYYNILWARV